MILSKKYRETVEQITLSAPLKEKILLAAEQPKEKKPPLRYIRQAAGLAACIALTVTGVSLSRQLRGTQVVQPVTPPPAVQTAAPAITPSPETPTVTPPEPERSQPEPLQTVPEEGGDATVFQPTGSALPPTGSLAEPASPTEPTAPNEELPSSQEEDPLTQGGSLFQDFSPDDEGVAALRTQVGYAFSIPRYLPEGYVMDGVSCIGGSMVQLSYCDAQENQLLYRTAQTTEDISGDYGSYTQSTQQMGEITVTLRERDGQCFSAVWQTENAYSLYSSSGLPREEMMNVAESVGEAEPANE